MAKDRFLPHIPVDFFDILQLNLLIHHRTHRCKKFQETIEASARQESNEVL
jgi:hypothetical protein